MGLGRKEILNLKVGGVYGEEWMDVSGEGFLGKCVYWKERMNVEKRGEYVRWGSCGVHKS